MASTEILIELGDFIKIISPAKPMYHLKTFLVEYIDDEIIEIIDIDSADKFHLDLYDDGRIMDELILSIHLLSRSEEPGYARQHGLLPGVWIDIVFSAEVDLTITGQIVDLEEDRIKILPKNDSKNPMYIDFAYQGIPKNIPIDKIGAIELPSVQESLTILSEIEEDIKKSQASIGEASIGEASISIASVETTPTGDINIIMPPNPQIDRNMFDVIKDIYIQADTIIFGKRVVVDLDIEVSRSEQRFGIEIQTNNLLDELLSKTPTHMRTPSVMERVNRIVCRFKELREEFSTFDNFGNVIGSTNFNAAYKPLAEQLNKYIGVRWIIPVSNQQLKLFDIPNNETTSNSLIDGNLLSNDLDTYTNAVNIVDSENRYSTFYNRINPIFTPFDKGTSNNGTNINPVGSDMEAIIATLDDYSAIVYRKFRGTSKLAKQRFVIQRYNMGLSKINKQLMNSGKYVYARGKITENDSINASSIVILPQPMIELSRVNLPGTNILNRANLSKHWLYYFQILNKKTNLNTVNLKSNSVIDYDKIAENPFMSHIINFGKTDLSYRQFLQAVIPRSVSIIRMLKENINRYNFHDILAECEPFLLYPDNITYSGRVYGERTDGRGGPYQEIRTHVIRKIKEYNIRHQEQRREFANLASIKSAKRLESIIYTDLRNNAAVNSIQKYYLLTDTNTTNEMLNRILAVDGGRAYYSFIAFATSYLYDPDLAKITNIIDKKEAFTNSKSCITKVIAKKYTSMTALQKDNGKEDVFFDRDYDKTPYNLLDKYRDAQKKRSAEDFIEYFRLVLIAEHGARPDLADDMVKTIIAKRKRIENGNYAVLIEYPQPDSNVDVDALSLADSQSILDEAETRRRIYYFVRKNHHWVKDTTMTDSEISNEMFCNIENKCFYDTLANSCDADAAAAKRMKMIARKSIGHEYDTTIRLSLAEINDNLKTKLENKLTDLKRVQRIRNDKIEQFTRHAYEIGTSAIVNEYVISPHEHLLSIVLRQSDFTKRQHDIIKFKGLFCREAVENEVANETPYWYYCQETNVKLMPTFIYILANTFVSGNDYEQVSEWLCSKIGRLSDDGESIVDRHSGHVIKKLDYSAEEGFDDAGFKINTTAVLEPDEYQMVRELISNATISNEQTIVEKTKVRVFENDTNRFIYGVSFTICENMSIRYEDLEADVMYLTNTFLNRKIMSRETYEGKIGKIDVKEGKKTVPYDKYLNKNIVLFTAAITYILIQSHIPSYKPRKTFPGCRFSLAGYPLDATGDTSGLNYLGCILEKMKSKTVEPFQSIYKSNQTAQEYTTMVSDIIKTKIIDEQEIVKLYVDKRDFLMRTPDDDKIPEEHAISKWVFFQPPIKTISVVKSLTGIANGYETELKTTIMRGHRTQHDLLGTMYKKIIEHTYGVVEEVNRIVAVEGKDAILRTGTIVFLENACCDETFHRSTAIAYFAERQPNISKNIEFVQKYGQLYSEFTKLATPSFLATGHKRPVNMSNLEKLRYSEDAIYGAYIHYCKLNSEFPIPDDIIPFCQEKPPGLENMSRPQMIEHLKDTRHTQTENSLANLMKIVAQRNIVAVDMNEPKLSKFMDHFEGLPQDPLITNVRDFIAKNKSASHLAEFLTEMNHTMLTEISRYVSAFGKRPPRRTNQIIAYFSGFMSWNNTQMTHDFIRSSVFMMSRVLPAMLEDKTNTVGIKNMGAMKHWDLSQKHNLILADLINEYYLGVNEYKRDEIINKLFHTISQRTHTLYSLNVFLENMPNGLSAIIMNKIYAYCYYSVFYEIFVESDNDKYAKLNIELAKESHRGDFDEMNITQSDNIQFKERICDLAIILIEMDIKNKKIIDLDYDMLTNKFHKESLREKKKITDAFGKMEVDERKTENVLKKYKLGKWNLGEQKGIFQYDKALFDTETDELMQDQALDQALDQGLDQDQGINATDLDQFELQAAQNEEDTEVNNMDFGADYDDGNYYDEDKDADRE